MGEEKKRKKKKDRLLVKANKRGKHVMHFLNFLRVLFYPWNAVFYPYKMHGYTKVGTGAYIYMGNHFSMWDIFYPARTTWEGIHYFTKASLMKVPLIGPLAKRAGVLSVMRDGTDTRALMDAIRILRNGEKVSIFPEGTRNRGAEDVIQPFHGGAALLAIKTKTPVVPFVVTRRPRLFRRTHVVFGEPLELTQFYDRKLTQDDYSEAEEFLRNRLYEIRNEFFAAREARKQAKIAKKQARKQKKCK